SGSAGSVVSSPTVDGADTLAAGAPRHPVTDQLSGAKIEGKTKTSAAWLIEDAGFSKGFSLGPGRAALSDKHTLALTNRGQARTADVIELANTIVAGVENAFGITLEPEPTFIGCALNDGALP